MPGAFTDIEHEVVAMLLEGEQPLIQCLRRQMAVCTVVSREFTGVGFFTKIAVPSEYRCGDCKLRLGDVVGSIPSVENGFGFVLFIEDGRIQLLEAYTYDEGWPDEIKGYELKYDTGGQRDWLKLAAAIVQSAER